MTDAIGAPDHIVRCPGFPPVSSPRTATSLLHRNPIESQRMLPQELENRGVRERVRVSLSTLATHHHTHELGRLGKLTKFNPCPAPGTFTSDSGFAFGKKATDTSSHDARPSVPVALHSPPQKGMSRSVSPALAPFRPSQHCSRTDSD
jgi:hypothetical protein